MRTVVMLLALAACATDPAAPGSDDEGGGDDKSDDGGDPRPPEWEVTDPTDADGDGIPEQLEDYLMKKLGPELRLAPEAIDWTRPANVDWYLPKVKMRFDHSGCPDDSENILDVGAITFDNIHAQDHFLKATGLGLCRHKSGAADRRFSNEKHLEFFLQPEDDALVHAGIPESRSSEWRTYIQVRPSTYVRASDGKPAAYDLQVWYFFAYNDFVGGANHESDWEHVTVSIDADYQFVSAFFATHDAGDRFDDPAQLQWSGTHLVGYIADGSHATYHSIGTHAGPVPGVDDHTYAGGPIWKSWENFVNLGQPGKILNGQRWAAYGGRWGEVGNTSVTSGVPGPMFNGKWDTKHEYPP